MSTVVAALGRPTQSTGPPVGPLPWRVVLSLAVVLTLGDVFWATSLREAIGAVERTGSPFKSWVRESLLVLPVFVLAVLVALGRARRRFGPSLRRGREVALTSVFVAAGATVAGTGLLLASATYDYHLQADQVRMMGRMGMGRPCVGQCLDAQLQATLNLQLRGLLVGMLLFAVTNVLLVFWVVGLKGGRLPLTRPLAPDRTRIWSSGHSRYDLRTRSDDLRLVAAAAFMASGVIHAAVVPEHMAVWPAAGISFILLICAEAGVALLLLHRPARAEWLGAAGVSGAPLLLWLVSRTAGLPVGPDPWAAEAVGLADLMACTLELLTLAIAVGALRTGRRVPRPPASTHALRVALVSVLALTTLGVAGTRLTWLGDLGVQDSLTSSEHSQ